MFVYLLRHYPQLSQTFVRSEITGLRALGHEVRVISLKASDTKYVDPVWAGPHQRWPSVSSSEGARALAWWLLHHPVCALRMLTAARTMGFSDHRRLALLEVPVVARRLASAGDVEAVHTHFAWPVSLEPTVLLARLLGARSSVTTHARDIYLPAPGLPWLLSLVDRMVTVCRYNVDELARTGLWPSDRPQSAVVQCGVDVPTIDKTRAADAAHIVSVGRLIEKKGFDDLIDAMTEVVRQVPDATLTIVGDGPQREALERRVVTRGLDEAVTLSGAAPHSQVLEAISSAQVFALACRVDSEGDSDAMPVVIREAMARAVPVVTTDVAGIGENVDDGVGWLVAPRDVQALSAALVEALERPVEAVTRGAAGRERVMESASAAGTARAMAAVLGSDTPALVTGTDLPSPAETDGHRYTAVTVVYEGDLSLLHLQARSMERHVNRTLFERYVVIDNTSKGLSRRSLQSLRAGYGSLAPRVDVVRADALADLPPVSGWWNQQVLKLAVAATIDTDRYVVLDAKNVVVRPLDRSFLEAPDGRSRLFPSTFSDHPLRPKLEATCRYLGIDPGEWMTSLGSTVTPFVMETAIVRELVDGIERSSGRSLAQEMVAHGLTEFFLYQGWIIASVGGLEAVHALERVRCPAVWPSGAGAAAVSREIARAEASDTPFFTVHQRALASFDSERVGILAGWWAERGLFASSRGARRFIKCFQSAWAWRARRLRTRRSVASAARRLGRPFTMARGSS